MANVAVWGFKMFVSCTHPLETQQIVCLVALSPHVNALFKNRGSAQLLLCSLGSPGLLKREITISAANLHSKRRLLSPWHVSGLGMLEAAHHPALPAHPTHYSHLGELLYIFLSLLVVKAYNVMCRT